MNHKDILKEKLKKYRKEDIIITEGANEQAVFRSINLKELRENIINPKRLVYAKRQKANKADEEKYICYFGYSKTQCHKYIIIVNKKCIFCTVIKIRRRWQRHVRKGKGI